MDDNMGKQVLTTITSIMIVSRLIVLKNMVSRVPEIADSIGEDLAKILAGMRVLYIDGRVSCQVPVTNQEVIQLLQEADNNNLTVSAVFQGLAQFQTEIRMAKEASRAW